MNIGLVLSGGGARGAAHIGAIKALEEHNLFPTHISGTSAGAIVGALYANGVDWKEILNFFNTVPIFRPKKYARSKPGFINTETFYNSLKHYFPEDSFKALKKPLFVTASNVVDGSLKIFSKGQLIKPLLASASFPGVFTPIEINGSYYIDGGALNNFPIEPLKTECDKIIGVYVNPLKKIGINDLKHSFSVVERAYRIKAAYESTIKFKDCDLLICPEELTDFSVFDMNRIETIFNLGYAATKKILMEQKSVVSSFQAKTVLK
ncbi:MAG: patatin-like phospholipase family protein [Aequorivita sp.]